MVLQCVSTYLFMRVGENSSLHIIILDEIDAICKQRGSTSGGTGVNVCMYPLTHSLTHPDPLIVFTDPPPTHSDSTPRTGQCCESAAVKDRRCKQAEQHSIDRYDQQTRHDRRGPHAPRPPRTQARNQYVLYCHVVIGWVIG